MRKLSLTETACLLAILIIVAIGCERPNVNKFIRMAFESGFENGMNYQKYSSLDRESPPVTGMAEEIAYLSNKPDYYGAIKKAIKEQYPTFDDNDIQTYFLEYFKYSKTVPLAMKHFASTQSTTIERLIKALEDMLSIAIYANEFDGGYTDRINIARKALASIKK